jgi:hypothetical protein
MEEYVGGADLAAAGIDSLNLGASVKVAGFATIPAQEAEGVADLAAGLFKVPDSGAGILEAGF